MSRKMLQIDNRRIPLPKCILCKWRYAKQFLNLFDGNIKAPLCLYCLFPRTNRNMTMDEEVAAARQKCEKFFREIVAKEWS